jgi:DNA-binding response OmpR family regulator
MLKTRVLYIEDEESLGRIVQGTLEHIGYEVMWKKTGSEISENIINFKPDICVLDIMLPDIDGYSLCKSVKARFPSLPVIFLTAKTETKNLVDGFEAGATDYLRKPFSIEELTVRIKNQLRQDKDIENNEKNSKLCFGSITVDRSSYELISPGRTVKLSNKDMEILKFLYSNKNKITSRKDLLMAVWGDDSYFNSRTLDVYIRKLRGYFSSDESVQLITLKGEGYMFSIR